MDRVLAQRALALLVCLAVPGRLGAQAVDFVGGASAVFVNPLPGSATVSGTGTSSFSWGTGGSSGVGFGSAGFSGNFKDVISLGVISYYNGVTEGGEIGSVDMQLTITLTTPQAVSQPVVRTLSVLTTPNDNTDPQGSADVLFLPSGFPAVHFMIGNQAYTLNLIGFGEITGDGFASGIRSFHVLEGGMAYAHLLGSISQSCVGPGTDPIREQIKGFGNCSTSSLGRLVPMWGRFGFRDVLEADSGDRLELKCDKYFGVGAAYQLYYTPAGGEPLRVGLCPFDGGCNSAEVFHSGDKNGNGKPDCFVRTMWNSADYHTNDTMPNAWMESFEPNDTYLDWAVSIYDASSGFLDKKDYKWEYAYGPPVTFSNCGNPSAPIPTGALVKVTSVDPPLGPETEAFYDRVLALLFQNQPTGVPMAERVYKSCDLDGDNICGFVDSIIMQVSNGTCEGDPDYLPTADIDKSGCVDARDRRYLLEKDEDKDTILDAADNCPTIANKTQVDTDHNGIGDACDRSASPAPTVAITGSVTAPGGAPLAGVTVQVVGLATTTITTAADGTFAVPGLTWGISYTVTPSAAGRVFTPATRSFTALTADQVATFVGTPVFQVSGHVRDGNGAGVPAVTVSLSGAASRSAITDIAGYYAFSGLAAGAYTVTPSLGTSQFAPTATTIPALQHDEVADFTRTVVGTYTQYFAEGATSTFFDTQIALLNASDQANPVTLRFQQQAPIAEVTHTVILNPYQRATIDPKTLGLVSAEFSTVVESTHPVVADRTVTWDATAYGSHAETAIASPLTRWYLAEGATINGFDLFYLIQNPNATAAQIEVRYLLPAPLQPVVKTYTVDPRSRFNIWVNREGAPLDAAEVSAVITSTNDVPVIVERAMYRPVGTQVFGAGHEGAGVAAPTTAWYFAEGATGTFFDLFFLIANPGSTAAQVEARYLTPDGTVIVRSYTVDPSSRFNVWVDYEGAELADTSVATTFQVTNGVPVIVERAMWWHLDGRDEWYEGHDSAGATTTGERWGLAAGEVGGATGLETYILIVNTSPTPGTARVTLSFDDGAQATKDVALAPTSRATVAVATDFPQANGRRFGAFVESLGTTPAQIVVERAMYGNAAGVTWAAGTSALGARLR